VYTPVGKPVVLATVQFAEFKIDILNPLNTIHALAPYMGALPVGLLNVLVPNCIPLLNFVKELIVTPPVTVIVEPNVTAPLNVAELFTVSALLSVTPLEK
jgi:hypothetical protein